MPDEKINKYGFIHVGKDLLEKAGLPAKTEVPLRISYDKARNAFVCVVDTTTPAEVGPEHPTEVVAENEPFVEMPRPEDEIAAEEAALKAVKDAKRKPKK